MTLDKAGRWVDRGGSRTAPRMSAFLQYMVSGLTIGSFLSLVALGYTMVYGIIRLINFAHGDLFMVGAFLGWAILAPVLAAHVPVALAVLIALVLAMLLTGGLGIAIQAVAYKPLLRAPAPVDPDQRGGRLAGAGERRAAGLRGGLRHLPAGALVRRAHPRRRCGSATRSSA